MDTEDVPIGSGLVGQSPAMRDLVTRIDRVAGSLAPVLITGETGTGKELVAKAIHERSARRARPFVAVNVAAIPEALLESEMFGHVRGAFTGAVQARRGRFAEASGGTLLLDEIGDMPLLLQAKLLRVLQSGELQPVGAEHQTRIDVRILAATHRSLPELVKSGQFREDLYYRLNVVNLRVPPLRDRAGDVAELTSFFLARARERTPTSPVRSIREDLQTLLDRRPWRGNVRELENTIERLVILSTEAELTPQHLAWIETEPEIEPEAEADYGSSEEDLPTVDVVVRRHVTKVLLRTKGDTHRAAKILSVDPSTLYRWRRKWGSKPVLASTAPHQSGDDHSDPEALSPASRRPRH